MSALTPEAQQALAVTKEQLVGRRPSDLVLAELFLMSLINRCKVQSAACLFTAGLAALPAGAQAQVVDGSSTRVENFLQGSPIVKSEDYPIESRFRGHSGVAEIALSVDFQGKPVTCIVSKSTGYPLLDKTTCRLFMERATYNFPENIKNTSSKFALPIEAIHKVRWTLDPGESRPLLYGVKLLEEIPYDNVTRTCKFSDGYTVRVAVSESCIKTLVKEQYMMFDKRNGEKISKSINLNIMEIYKQQSDAGNATSSFNLALLQARFGYEQWSTTMKASADQGATLGAHYMCVSDSRSMNEPVQSEARFKYCKQAYLGGMRISGNYIGQIIAEDKTLSALGKLEKIQSLDTESFGMFKTTPTALGAAGLANLELGNEEQAFLFLYNLVLRGDVVSRKHIAHLFSKPKGRYFNPKASEIWLRAYIVGQERTGNRVPKDDGVVSKTYAAQSIIDYCDLNPSRCDDNIDQGLKKQALDLTSGVMNKYVESVIVQSGVVKKSDYPLTARAKNIFGVTQHMYNINAASKSDECYTLVSNLLYSMDNVACKRLMEGSFKPASFDGHSVPNFRTQPIRWSLTGTSQNNSGALGILFTILGIVLR
jgi:hypothetical protein